MRYLLLALALPLAACSARQEEAPQPPIGMANPASVYCLQKGGERVPVQTPQGILTQCKLPDGTTTEEWELYRHDHPAPAR
ncbi:DUF333 domain-containing protein [Pseudenterobacter timonensis]|uniref:DUF333 domain-containing protein n=1 Tax=Pseudenterobacter timonensis TaxID=1755099 RepID=A0AAE4DPS8_9ENTR|nr:DUF333 domain-containing protein [Pseudenterobacter timonensis]MDR9891797.1 DUF333 domain-containing protein [Pseudenterobacter timonensis]